MAGYYLIKYMNKEKAELNAVAVAILEARKHERAHPSVAENTGTEMRTTQHIFTRLVNNISSSKEYSSNMAAYALLDGKPFSGSNAQEWFAYPWPALADILKEREIDDADDCSDIDCPDIAANNDEDEEEDKDDDISCGDQDDKSVLDFDEDEEFDDNHVFGLQQSSETLPLAIENTSSIFTTILGKTVSIPQHVLYHYRGLELEFLCFLEWIQLIKIVKDPSAAKNAANPKFISEAVAKAKQKKEADAAKTKIACGRKSNHVIPFDDNCPLRGMYNQQLRSQYPMWILAGRPPPKYDIANWRLGKKMIEANRYARYWLTLLIPWQLPPQAAFQIENLDQPDQFISVPSSHSLPSPSTPTSLLSLTPTPPAVVPTICPTTAILAFGCDISLLCPPVQTTVNFNPVENPDQTDQSELCVPSSHSLPPPSAPTSLLSFPPTPSAVVPTISHTTTILALSCGNSPLCPTVQTTVNFNPVENPDQTDQAELFAHQKILGPIGTFDYSQLCAWIKNITESNPINFKDPLPPVASVLSNSKITPILKKKRVPRAPKTNAVCPTTQQPQHSPPILSLIPCLPVSAITLPTSPDILSPLVSSSSLVHPFLIPPLPIVEPTPFNFQPQTVPVPPARTYYVDNCHLAILVNDANMNLKSGQTMLSQAYRARCATIWTELENADYRAQNPLKKSRKKEEESFDEGETLEWLQAEADGKNSTRYENKLRAELDLAVVFESFMIPIPIASGSGNAIFLTPQLPTYTKDTILHASENRAKTKEVKKVDVVTTTPPIISNTSTGNGILNIFDTAQDCSLRWLCACSSINVEPPPELLGNEDQCTLFRIVMTNIRDRAKWYLVLYEYLASGRRGQRPCESGPPQLLLKIIGAPGVGKTFTFKCMRDRINQHHNDFVKAAFTANASILFDAQTLHHCFKFPSIRSNGNNKRDDSIMDSIPWPKLTADKLQQLASFFSDKVATFIDEDSLIAAPYLDLISMRHDEVLRPLFKEFDRSGERPFGGFSVILCGDPYQISPVMGAAVHKDFIRSLCIQQGTNGSHTQSVGSSKTANGLHLFTQFTKFEMTKQIRAQSDETHSRFITLLRNHETFNRFPVKSTLIQTHIQDFTAQDIDDDPDWEFPTFVVSTNAERARINKFMMARYGQRKRQAVLSWPLPMVDNSIAHILMSRGDKENFYESDCEANFIFSPGARAVLDLAKNSTDKRIVKGSPCTFHTILCSTSEQEKELESKTNLSILTGETQQLSFVPSHILVRITDETTKDRWEKDAKGNYANSMVKDDLVLAMPLGENTIVLDMDSKRHVKLQTYPVDPAYAVSFHKLQGYTADKLVLQLNYTKGGTFFNSVYIY